VSDNAARLQLYLHHRAALINYAKAVVGERMLAEDVVQDAFLRFSDPGDEPLEQPVAYLYRIVRNLALDTRRRAGTESRQQQSPPQWMQPAQTHSPEQQALQQDDINRVAVRFANLPEQMRVAVEMHRLGEYTLQQIATHLGISVSTAHRLVRDAVVRLADGLAAEQPASLSQPKERSRG
jgi:RNA polymerase sigma-70 factor (ECF subfamily)